MTDTYTTLVNTGATKAVARRLGLPRPGILRRHEPGAPLVTGPVLVLGDAADDVAEVLLGWDLDVRRRAEDGERLGAIVLVLTSPDGPADLSEPFLTLGGSLRSLVPSGRVIVVTRPVDGGATPAAAAARAGTVGALRSLAKELRAGATGNAVSVTDGVALTAPTVVGALRFLLSARSAYVSGQVLAVTTADGELPDSWERPLTGRTALVTGAARGIGAAIATTLAAAGAEMLLVDVPAAGDALARVANRVRGTALQLDITAPDAGERLAAAAARLGRLDVVVHNAGITRDKLLANMSPERWDPVLEVNLLAPLALTEHLLAAGALGDRPRVVCLASTSAIAGNRGQTNYAASKAGLIGLAAALAPRLAEAGGTINAVAPGFIETEMTARMPLATRELARRVNSLQQGGEPVDVAEAIAFLASPQGGGINGTVLRVCGQHLVGA